MNADKFNRNVLIARALMFVFLGALAVYITCMIIIYGVSDFLVLLGLSMLFIGPAYIANAMMVFTSDGKPLDGGKNFIDGKRLFGKTKTRGGFIGGCLFGFLFASLFFWLFYFFYPAIGEFARTQQDFLNLIDLKLIEDFLHPEPLVVFIRSVFCGIGAPIGDLVGSFMKRRFSIGSGQPFWLVDQLDFIIISILLNYFWFPLDFYIILLLTLISPSIALFANNVAYYLGRKKEPW